MNIDKYTCGVLRKEITEALTAVLEKYDLRVELGHITYEPGNNLRCRMMVSQKTPVRPTLDTSNPFKPTQVLANEGDVVMFQGKRYTYAGPLSGRKYKHRIKREDGRLFKMTTAQLILGLQRKPANV